MEGFFLDLNLQWNGASLIWQEGLHTSCQIQFGLLFCSVWITEGVLCYDIIWVTNSIYVRYCVFIDIRVKIFYMVIRTLKRSKSHKNYAKCWSNIIFNNQNKQALCVCGRWLSHICHKNQIFSAASCRSCIASAWQNVLRLLLPQHAVQTHLEPSLTFLHIRAQWGPVPPQFKKSPFIKLFFSFHPGLIEVNKRKALNNEMYIMW